MCGQCLIDTELVLVNQTPFWLQDVSRSQQGSLQTHSIIVCISKFARLFRWFTEYHYFLRKIHLKCPLISMNQSTQELDSLYLQVFHWKKASPNSPSTSTSTEVEVVFPWHGRSCRALCQGGGGRKWLGNRESSVACDVNVRYLKEDFFRNL